MGIVFALLVILICRQSMGDAVFGGWGWRIPFLISAILVLLSGYVRLKLEGSPLYARLKEEGKASTNPIKATYISGRNWSLMGSRCSARRHPRASSDIYIGQFHALIYMTTVLKLRPHRPAEHHDGGLRAGGDYLLAQGTGIALGALIYPIVVSAIGVAVSLGFMREPTHKIRIWDEVGGGAPPLVPDQP